MTGHKKVFDCIEMKNTIQKTLLDRWKDMGGDEIRRQLREELQTSQSPIARWWRSVSPKGSKHIVEQ